MKKFNTTAVCIQAKHYMVDISDRVSRIRKMVDAGEYFTINRARQYGKTTTKSIRTNEKITGIKQADCSKERHARENHSVW